MAIDELNSDDSNSDTLSIPGEDIDVNLNHYRIPKATHFGSDNPPKNRSPNGEQVKHNNDGQILSLLELTAQKIACSLPYGALERHYEPIPEPLQCRIAYWGFPQDEEDIKLYTCLASGNADVFVRAEELIRRSSVCDMLQVGFHLSANVQFMNETEELECFRVAITFDRRRITSSSCTCSTAALWCQHVVAVCLQRIRKPQEVSLRVPVSESLMKLDRNQLLKFSQYLINELPQQILPPAQKLLDELLSSQDAFINRIQAAPDPTAGASVNEQTCWCLDYTHLSIDIQRILHKQCTTQPTVCSDIQSLHITAPPAATEYSQLLRPIRGREPEGLWNLISIVNELMKRRDSNFLPLLEIITDEIMKFDKIICWWLETKVSLHSGSTIHFVTTKNSQSTSQYSCSNFCDEVVHLWRLAALNPTLTKTERKSLYDKFFAWHLKILQDHAGGPENNPSILTNNTKSSKRKLLEMFPGFKPSLEGCLIDWPDWNEKKAQLDLDDGMTKSEVKTTKTKKRRPKRKSKAAKLAAAAAEQKRSEDNDENAPPAEPENNVDREDQVVVQDQGHQDDQPVNENEEPLHEIQEEPQPEQANAVPREPIEDDLEVYYMEQNKPESPQNNQKSESLESLIGVNMKKLNDPLEIMYAKTEGLHAHGYILEARKLAHKVATEVLTHQNYPSLKHLCTLPRRRKKKGSSDNQMSIVASETLNKISFLCRVLMDDPANHNLIFRLLLFGVELKRSPAATKPFEVKLINQKNEMITLLKNITLSNNESSLLRDRALSIRDLESSDITPDALTTLILGNYIFDALVLSKTCVQVGIYRNLGDDAKVTPPAVNMGQQSSRQVEDSYFQANDQPSAIASSSQPTESVRTGHTVLVQEKSASDMNLGYEAALVALGVRTNISETDHPLLCEGIRRQRGDLALSLLSQYKDDQEKLDSILDRFLDTNIFTSNSSALSDSSDKSATKKSATNQEAIHPTEASAHFMFELAKTVFDKAGGNSMTAHLFRPQLSAQNGGRGIHRRLHMCTLRIALYALGLQNRTAPNWMQRTYNGRAMFIHEQALEIGLPAIRYLCDNWQGYLTPVEAASIADKAGCLNDPEAKRIAAEMAKSCLKYANFLDLNAVSRILVQCKEQTMEMIKEACAEIEQVAEYDSVCADVLFATARAWYDLYWKLVMSDRRYDELSHYKMNNVIVADQESGVSDWLGASANQPPAEKCQQINEPLHPIQWDMYARVDFIPTTDTPIYQNIDYVKAAYRVGMKALDAIKMHNPKKVDEILWLLGLSKSLGRDCLLKFSESAKKNISDPFILHIIVSDLLKFFETLPEDHTDRVTILLPIINQLLERCVRKTRELMKHNISYDQRNCVESILDIAQHSTGIANTFEAASHFKDLLKIVDNRKTKKYRFIIETHRRHIWVDGLISTIEYCTCPCNRFQMAKFACNQRPY